MATPSQAIEISQERPSTSEKKISELFSDDVAYNLIISVEDSARAAWNGWEVACKFEDGDKQEYYMKIIIECGNFMRKIRKL